MQSAEIGPWEFSVPDHWNIKIFEGGLTYFESPEGAHGMYVKSVELEAQRDSAQDVATYIQDVHHRNFTSDPDSRWRVVDRRGTLDGTLYRSSLDMFDSAATYRVLSLVVCDTQRAIQVTIHDYLCDDYSSAKNSYADVECSINKSADAGAA